MEAPKCKLCGKRHYGMCDIPDLPAEPIKEKRKVLPAAKPPDSIKEKILSGAVCEICGDKAHHDYLAADKLRKKLYMQERRAKEQK